MRVIYIDTLFAINTIVNYFLILGTAKVCAIPSRRLRLLLSAAAGGVYGVVCAIPDLAFMGHVALRLLFALVMLFIAFETKHFDSVKKLIRTGIVFFAMSMLAAGAVAAISLMGGGNLGPVSLRLLIIAFIVCYALASLVFRRAARATERMVWIKIVQQEDEISLRALVDTGNSLADPFSGSKVCVVHIDDLLPIMPENIRTVFRAAADTCTHDKLIMLNRIPSGMKFRLVPFSAVGVERGSLLGFRPQEFYLEGKPRRDYIVAVSPNQVSDSITYQALV